MFDIDKRIGRIIGTRNKRNISRKAQIKWKIASTGKRIDLRKQYKDSDGDRVPDKFDCSPFNVMRQDRLDLFHAGDESPSNKINKGEVIYAFLHLNDAKEWKKDKNKKHIYKISSSVFMKDNKTYSRHFSDKYTGTEYIVKNILGEEIIE